ncbi:MAG: ATP-binding protein [Porticoccaceae bacterium]
MIPGPSLKRHLSLAILVVLTLLGIAIASGANLLFDRLEARVSEARVSSASERLLGAIRQGQSGPYLDPSRLDPEFNRPLSGQYFVVTVGEQRWRSRSLWDSELPTVSGKRPGAFVRAPGPGGQQLLLLTRVFERFGQRFTITVASDYGPLVAEFRRGLYLFIGLWGLALAASLLALNLWLNRALEPVALARRQVAEVRAGKRESLAGEFPRELAPLIEQINTLLGETRAALIRSRNALGNLGHALKTPLAVLSNLVEREDIRRNGELHQALRAQLDQLGGRINRELSQSQGTRAGGTLEPFVPARDLPPLLKALERAHRRSLTVNLRHTPELSLRVERAELLEVLGNVLDNAWKWARSRIDVAIDGEGGHWHIRIEDDGPGIADPAARQRALGRGERLDESVAGQGLGLAIAADIIAAHRGSLALETSTLGGLAVRIDLPLVATDPD